MKTVATVIKQPVTTDTTKIILLHKRLLDAMHEISHRRAETEINWTTSWHCHSFYLLSPVLPVITAWQAVKAFAPNLSPYFHNPSPAYLIFKELTK